MSEFNLGAMAPTGMQFDAPQRGGMFGGGADWKSALQAAFAGYMARQNPQVANSIFGNLQDAQALKQHEAQYQRQRQDQNADWQAHYDYEAAHPRPGQPGEFEGALVASGVQPGTPQWTEAMKQRVGNILDPVVMTPQGPMLRSQLLGGGQPAPPGITFTPLDNGGPSHGGSGGFPGQ